jgi:HK97 family phage major capsid protein
MPEYTPNEVMEAVKALETNLKTFGSDSADYKQAVENTIEILEKQETDNQGIIKDLAAAKAAQEQQTEKMTELELELARGGKSQAVDYKTTPSYLALQKWCAQGDKFMSKDEFSLLSQMDAKTLRTDIDTGAGYLTMPEMDTSITKTITEISNMRSVARVRSTSKKVLDMPIRTSVPTATYEGEAASGDDSESAYGSEQLTSFRLTLTVPFTQDQMMDSAFDLESEINADVAEGMAKKEGNKFVLGTGSKQPEGVLVNPTIVAGAFTSTVSGGFAAADLTYLTGELKVGYDPMYAFNRRTLAYARSLEDSAGRPIWQINLADKAPNTINGEPYVLFPDMPNTAANNLAVIYGDFRRGYTITDRTGLMIIRDQYAKKRQAIIEITFHKWNTGQVTLPEAFIAMKIKT